jgi:uncharacterized protein YqeY
MKILEQVKLDATLALKNGEKEKRIVLLTLTGIIQQNTPEIVNGVKIWTDEQAVKTIKKLVESNIETGKLNENEYISIYLPKLMTSEELESVISTHITDNSYSGMKDMGKVMNFLTINYTSLYDGKEASSIVKKLLN